MLWKAALLFVGIVYISGMVTFGVIHHRDRGGNLSEAAWHGAGWPAYVQVYFR